MAEQESKKSSDASIAWFKLAELIARKEREKALSVYRLLAHSLQDRAYALQLEGDILWSLEDNGSFERYKQAAYLYQKDKRWIEAIAIYENLLLIGQNNNAVLATLIPCYAMANLPEVFQGHIKQLCTHLENQSVTEQQFIKIMHDIMTTIQDTMDHGKQQWVYEQLDSLTSGCPESVRREFIK
jgi:tetratricopeptide (TPR) repeat protein